MIVNPIATTSSVLALFFQGQKASALSFLGLATQAVVFAPVAFFWIWRVNYIDLREIPLPIPLYILKVWYEVVGWAAVDNAVFAIVQFVLLCLARRQQRGGHARPDQEPLLSH